MELRNFVPEHVNNKSFYRIFTHRKISYKIFGAWGSVVVKALRY